MLDGTFFEKQSGNLPHSMSKLQICGKDIKENYKKQLLLNICS
jgi:hypothetical protein